METTIQEFEKQDKPQLIELIDGLRDFLVTCDNDHLTERKPGYGEHAFDNIILDITKHNGKIFVAKQGDQVISMIVGYIPKRTIEEMNSFLPQKVGFVRDLFVAESFRGKQIGKKLMHELETYFHSQSCDYISVDVSYHNKEAYTFYLRLKFKDRMLHLLKKIDPLIS